MDGDKTIYAEDTIGNGNTDGGSGGYNEQIDTVTLTLVYDSLYQMIGVGTPDVKIQFDSGTLVDLSKLDEAAGYKWYEDSCFNNEITAPFNINGDKTIYSGEKTTQAEKVKLTLVYGNGNNVTKEFDKDSLVNLSDLSEAAGYTWYEDTDFNTEITKLFTMDADKTVYARTRPYMQMRQWAAEARQR
jgi:hypothetical protein